MVNFIVQTLSVDPSDPIYQSFHSATKTGLEIGSLAVGGYSIVKSAVRLTKLAKLRIQIPKFARYTTKELSRSNGFLGHRGFELENAQPYQPLRNQRAYIQGREYSGHALDQMQNRGITPSIVEETIKRGTRFLGKSPESLTHCNACQKKSAI